MDTVIKKQPHLRPLSTEDRLMLDFLIREYDRLERAVDGISSAAYIEQLGIRSAIAFFSGIHLISTPEGGVEAMLPTLRHILKGA